MDIPSGPPLGILSVDYPSSVISLQDGDKLLLLTDGVFEAKSKEGQRIGFGNLVSFIKGHMFESDLLQQVIDYVEHFSKGLSRADDLTILELRWDTKV